MAEKRVFFYRHGPKDKGPKTGGGNLAIPLTQEGAEKMMRVAQNHVQEYGRPVAIYCSPAARAHQTGMCFALAAGKGYPIPESSLLGRHQQWDTFSPTCKTALDFYRDLPEFMEEEAEAIWVFVQIVAQKLNIGDSVVCVGHAGLIETTAAIANRFTFSRFETSLEELMPQSIGEGEGIVFIFDGTDTLVRFEKLQ